MLRRIAIYSVIFTLSTLIAQSNFKKSSNFLVFLLYFSVVSFTMNTLILSFREPVLELVYTPLRNMSIARNIKFNTKHLAKGDPVPPYTGKLRLYNMRYCPYAHRTVLALNAKQLDYEVVNINLMNKPEWLPTKSAFAKVPAIEIKENLSIFESLITVEYLDEVYPHRPLISKDPVKKAFDKILIEATTPLVKMFYKVARVPDKITEDTITAYHETLTLVQNELNSRGTKYLGGTEPAYVDYMIWPWIEKLWLLQDYDKRVLIDPIKYKRLVEYISSMLKDPAIAQYLIPKEVLCKILDGYKPGNVPPYDILIKK